MSPRRTRPDSAASSTLGSLGTTGGRSGHTANSIGGPATAKNGPAAGSASSRAGAAPERTVTAGPTGRLLPSSSRTRTPAPPQA